ncbi:MAG: DUF1016 domain-containing protein [Bacteroidales bacterium]|nr:DUF1016 domain-containing protein [Bacteroides sp.]MCM1197971.1 DUF1016 domain-containing protein [Clostridium sp.]MCM1502726.1 DUF1016 domain-containing protein [Bacteroidales bacterium]
MHDENPTIGILLGTSKNATVVKMTLTEKNTAILASEYHLYLPPQEQLIGEVDSVRQAMAGKIESYVPDQET